MVELFKMTFSRITVFSLIIYLVSSQVLDKNGIFEASRLQQRHSQQKERIESGSGYFKLENCLKRNREFRSYTYDENYQENKSEPEPLIDKRYYQHTALVGWNSTRGVVYICTGVLITTRFVLTAPYCTQYTDYSKSEDYLNTTTYKANTVRLGDLDMTKSEDDIGVQQHSISRIITNNTISLLKLPAYLRKTLKVVPACLNDDTSDNFKNRLLRSGHYLGKTVYDPSADGGALYLTEVIQKLESPYVCLDQNSWNRIYNFRPESDECFIAHLKADSVIKNYNYDNTCIGCSFVQYQRDEVYENVWYHNSVVVGIAHELPSGCPIYDYAKSYTNIAPYIDWIESIVVKQRFKEVEKTKI